MTFKINCDLTPAYMRATPSCPRSHHPTPSSHISTHAQPPSFSPDGGGGPEAAAPAPAATGLAVVSPGVCVVRPACMQVSVSARARAWACVACPRSVCSVRVPSRARGCVARSRMNQADLSAPNYWPGVQRVVADKQTGRCEGECGHGVKERRAPPSSCPGTAFSPSIA